MKFCPECGSKLSITNIDNARRHRCDSDNCNYVYWNNPVPVVAALVRLDGQYILARNTAWPAGIFSLITGYLEYGEEPQEAVLREVNEELGLQGTISHFLGHHMFTEKNQLIIAFEVEATGCIMTNHELAEIKSLSPGELAKYDFSPLYITERVITEWRNVSSMEGKS